MIPGTIVTSKVGTDEQIIGIAIDGCSTNLPRVMWISNIRGIFVSEEGIEDLDIAPLSPGNGSHDDTDPLLDASRLALLVNENLAALVKPQEPHETELTITPDPRLSAPSRWPFVGGALIPPAVQPYIPEPDP